MIGSWTERSEALLLRGSSSCRKSTIPSRLSSNARYGRDLGPRKMTNNNRHAFLPRASRTRRLLTGPVGAMVVVLGGLWAAGLTPLDAFEPAPDVPGQATPQLKAISA